MAKQPITPVVDEEKLMAERTAFLTRARGMAKKGNHLWAQMFADKAHEIKNLTPAEADSINKYLVRQGCKTLWQ